MQIGFILQGITPAIGQGAADVCLEAAKAANKLGVTVSCDLATAKIFGNMEYQQAK